MTVVNVGRRVTRSFVFDAAVMAACVAVEVTFAVLGVVSQRSGTVAATAMVLMWTIQVAADACLLFRRRFPLTVLGVAVVASVPVIAAVAGLMHPPSPGNTDPWMPAAAPIAAYSAVVYAKNRTATWVLIAGLAVAIARPWQLSWVTVTTSLLVALPPALLGMYIAARRRLIGALTDRAERAEHEQLLLAERARAEERVRLASEMHDVVSHRVSLMVLQAGSLRVTATDPATRAAAEELRSAGTRALDELRDLIGVLRTAPPPDLPETPDASSRADTAPGEDPAAGMPALSALIAESESVGVAVELTEDGNPDRLTPAVGRTAHRVVQEALTNVRKHAPGARARVRVRYGGDHTTVTVHNDPPTADGDPALSGTGSGTGLSGLRHRVELLGGTLRTEALERGGFTVEAALPNQVPTHVRGHS